MDQMIPGMHENVLSLQFKVRDAYMHRVARACCSKRSRMVE